MSKISCEVIKDLMPLYIDDVASQETRKLVEEHAQECESCKTELEVLAEEVQIPVRVVGDAEGSAFIAKIKTTVRRKQIIAALISALLIVGVYTVLCIPTKVIPYEEGLINITEEAGKVYAQFAGDNYDGVYMFTEPIRVAVDGTEKIAVAMYYEQSLYSKFIDPVVDPAKKFDIHCLNAGYNTSENGKEVHVDEELIAVYYSPEKIDVRSQSGENWYDNIDEMELIWEK